MANQLLDYLQRASSLYNRSEELQSRFDSPSDPEFAKYVDTEAIINYRELQETGVPFPPWQEMITVGGETDLRLFLSIGYSCYQSMRKYFPPTRSPKYKILDFGVGCARTMRFFFREMDQFECFGCDVDRRAIRYLQQEVPFIDAITTNNLPPLPYPDDFFDNIYSISVFSHLKREVSIAWLNELSRIIKPGGQLQITVHGALAVSLLHADPKRRGLIGISDKEFETQLPEFNSDGYAWLKHTAASEDIDQTQYGISFFSQSTLSEICKENYVVDGYFDGEIGGWQDLAILQSRKG